MLAKAEYCSPMYNTAHAHNLQAELCQPSLCVISCNSPLCAGWCILKQLDFRLSLCVCVELCTSLNQCACSHPCTAQIARDAKWDRTALNLPRLMALKPHFPTLAALKPFRWFWNRCDSIKPVSTVIKWAGIFKIVLNIYMKNAKNMLCNVLWCAQCSSCTEIFRCVPLCICTQSIRGNYLFVRLRFIRKDI